jgi:predicted CXXCH cytochrome family protein
MAARAIVLAFTVAAFGLAAGAGAAPNKPRAVINVHDLRATSDGVSACETCHPPDGPADRMPAPGSAGRFRVYDAMVNPEFRGGRVDLAEGSGSSLVCLGCHDGTLAPASGHSAPGDSASLGLDLANDHPVGFSYARSQTALPLKLNALPRGVKLFGPDQRMECQTCHDVHQPGVPKLLRLENLNSALCLSCHL